MGKERRRIRLFLLLLLVTPSVFAEATSSATSPTPPSGQQLAQAALYLAARYNPTVGLVSESEDRGSNVPDGTPAYRTYWICSDNLWAQEALQPFYPEIAQNISRTITPYLATYGPCQLFEVMLGKTIPTPIHDGRDIPVGAHPIDGNNHTLWLDRHQAQDGGIFFDAAEYADLTFYLTLNHYLRGDTAAAERWFREGEALWSNYGFLDKAARASQRFQNYKLGLYLFTVKATGFASPIYEQVETVAWRYQKGNGGIAAQSFLNGTIYGTANVETTSALLMAYDEPLIQRFRAAAGEYWERILIVMAGAIAIVVLMLLLKDRGARRRASREASRIRLSGTANRTENRSS